MVPDGSAERGLLGRMRPAFATGWWFGFGYFVAGLWWLGNALLVDANGFAWALPLAVFGLPAVLRCFTVLRHRLPGCCGRTASVASPR